MTPEEEFPVNCRVERTLLRGRPSRAVGKVVMHSTRGKRKGWPVVLWDGTVTLQHADPKQIRRVDEQQ